jgi:hypothetical protein
MSADGKLVKPKILFQRQYILRILFQNSNFDSFRLPLLDESCPICLEFQSTFICMWLANPAVNKDFSINAWVPARSVPSLSTSRPLTICCLCIPLPLLRSFSMRKFGKFIASSYVGSPAALLRSICLFLLLHRLNSAQFRAISFVAAKVSSPPSSSLRIFFVFLTFVVVARGGLLVSDSLRLPGAFCDRGKLQYTANSSRAGADVFHAG